jgi:hypothetical protein
MTGRGKYVRTQEIRERNSRNASGLCPSDCMCGKHQAHPHSHGKPCEPDCTCGRHTRTREHNMRISFSRRLP